ncbi:MAG: FapA family protein [Candidatus Gracilibacteria bacterium]|nr:FapA family protein [Candidatus Gracilibacteria bacterium]
MKTKERVRSSTGGGKTPTMSPAINSRRVEVLETTTTILSETNGTWSEIKAKYNSIVEEDGLVKVDFSNFKFEKESSGNLMLLNFFKDLFNKGFYMKGIYNNLEILNKIYDVKYFKQEDTFILGTAVSRMSKEDLNMYSKPELSGKNDFAKYDFLPSQIYDRDKFIANLYKNGIVYGYDKKGIEDGIDHSLSGYKQKLYLTIARQKEAVNGIDASVKIVSSKVKEDYRARTIVKNGLDSKEQAKYFEFANSTNSVEAGIKIIKKIPATTGEPGRNVLGKVIANIPGADKIILSDMIGEGLEVRTDENGEEFVFTSRAGKLQEDRATGKRFVTEGYKFNEIDHNHTGDIDLVENENYSIEGDIQQGRKIKGNGKYVEIGGNVFGTIEVGGETDILIKGHLSGKAKIIHHGTGKIVIEGKIMTGALLNARKSHLKLGSLEIGNIFVNELELETFAAGNIVARTMDITDFSIGQNAKVSLIGENIHIKNFNSPGICRVTLMSKFLNSGEKKKNFDSEIIAKKEEIKNIILKDFKAIQLNLSDPFLLDSIDSIAPNVEKYIQISKGKLTLLGRKENEVPEKYKAAVKKLMLELPTKEQNYTYDLKRNICTQNISEELNPVIVAYNKISGLYNEIAKKRETIEKINNIPTSSSLKIDKPRPLSIIELYSYETGEKDFYELIDDKELISLIRGDRPIDGIIFSRTNFKLGSSPVNYISDKKEA